jgi:hypothetical protein
MVVIQVMKLCGFVFRHFKELTYDRDDLIMYQTLKQSCGISFSELLLFKTNSHEPILAKTNVC